MAQHSGPFHRCTPGPPLSEFVDSLWIYEGYVQPHARERLLPTGTMELVFTLDADGRARSGVAGARSEFLVLDTSRPFSVIGVHFRPGGGLPFFGVPAGELHNRSVTLDMVWGGYAATVRDRLWAAETSERRFRILERALLDRACGRLEALRRIEQLTDVDWMHVALSCGYFDQAHFNHDFRAFSGINPSTYLRHRTSRTHVAVTD